VLSAIAKVVAGIFGIGISAYASASAIGFTERSVRDLASTVGSTKSGQKAAIG
jgi:hypothetical protein